MSGTDGAVGDSPPRGIDLHHGWAGSRSGPITVVLHGGGPGCHAASDFAAVMACEPARRWLWVDLPGYGGSRDTHAADTGTAGGTFAVAVRSLERLLVELGLVGVDVLAQSLGGSVALQLAATRPDLLGRIVAIGSQPLPPRPGEAANGLGSRARATYFGGTGPTVGKMRALVADLEWHDPTRIPDATVAARHRASLAGSRDGIPVPDLTDALGAVRCPTLIISGRHDRFAGPGYAGTLADALPRADLNVLEGTAHHPQAEQPETVAALVNAFLIDRS